MNKFKLFNLLIFINNVNELSGKKYKSCLIIKNIKFIKNILKQTNKNLNNWINFKSNMNQIDNNNNNNKYYFRLFNSIMLLNMIEQRIFPWRRLVHVLLHLLGLGSCLMVNLRSEAEEGSYGDPVQDWKMDRFLVTSMVGSFSTNWWDVELGRPAGLEKKLDIYIKE